MAIPSGLDAQLGTAEEVTYGTPVTCDKFYEFRGGGPKYDRPRIESQGLKPGRRILPSARWAGGKVSIGGDIPLELVSKGFGRWFKHAMGAVATTQPNVGTDPTVFLHTFTPGAFPTGLTVQLGKPDTSGTVRPATYHGCKIAAWSLKATVDEIVTFTPTLLGEDEDTATALAAAVYPTGTEMSTFLNTTLTVAGSPMDVKSFELNANNGLKEDRFFLGSQLRKQPTEVKQREITGTLEPEFTDYTAYTRFVNGTEAALVASIVGSTISGIYKYQTVITANVRFDGETPDLDGMDMVKQNLPFKVIDSGTSSLKIEYQTTDTTP